MALEMTAHSEAKVEIFFPFYVGDYDRDTADLSFEEHGFYLAILRALWVRGGTLDSRDKPRLARILRTDTGTLDRLWPTVERFFVLKGDGTFNQKRLTFELEKARRLKEVASRAGHASANTRRAKHGTAQPSRTTAERPLERESERQAEQTSERPPNPSPSPSESPSESDPHGSGRGVSRLHEAGADTRSGKPSSIWTQHDWLQQFKQAFQHAKGGFYGGGAADAKATAELGDLLKALPEPDRLAAQRRAPAMFAEYFDDDTPGVARARHCFVFFVTRWNGLRMPTNVEPEDRPRPIPPLPAAIPNARAMGQALLEEQGRKRNGGAT